MSETYSLGIDIGGTKIEVCLVQFSSNQDLENKLALDEKNIRSFTICNKARIPTERQKGYNDVLKRLKLLVSSLITSSNLAPTKIKMIGVGMPGSVHPTTLKMIHGNSDIFANKDIKGDLLEFFNLQLQTSPQVFINNDANCFALAEALGGAGTSFQSETKVPFNKQVSIGVILGTGCGGGVVINGKLLTGKMGGGGEIGHTTLVNDGRDCYCGKKGCAELYLSGSGFEISFNLKNSSMSEDTLKAKEIFDLIGTSNETVALAVIEDYQEDLLRFLGNLSNIFDPHFFVFGGGLSNQDAIYSNLESKLKEINFLKDYSPKIYKNLLGDSAGVLGAALLPYL